MNRTKIEYVDYTLNPVKGLCPVGCSYCYARAMYKRFNWNPEVRFDYRVIAKAVNELIAAKPARIFWGSTFELFHESVWTHLPIIFQAVKVLKQHSHLFLTKQPHNLPKWSPFPDNCWVGVTLTHQGQHGAGISPLMEEIAAPVKFLSIEPMLTDMPGEIPTWCRWVIIGQQTPVSQKTAPKVEWIREIVDAADKASVPVFLKDNLKPLLCDEAWSDRRLVLDWTHGESEFEGIVDCKLRQEFPNGGCLP